MIPKVQEGVAQILKGLGFPFPVLYAPERTERMGYGDVVTFQRARGGESFGPAPATNSPKGPNGKQLGSWLVAGVVHIYGRSPRAGATIKSHEEWTDHHVSMVVCALIDWCRDNSHTLEISDAGYIDERDRSEEEQAPGVVYRLAIRVGRGVYRRGYDHPLPEIAVIKAVVNYPPAVPPDEDGDDDEEDPSP